MNAVLAADLGGTHLRLAVAPLAEPQKLRTVGEWSAPQSRDAFLSLLRRELEATGATHLGLGIPGLARGSVCSWVPNLPFLDGLDLRDALPNIIVGLGNDAQLALLAEVTTGAAKGMSDALLLAIGTGIGSAVLAGGTIIAGAHGGACSFGWAAADVHDRGEDRSGWLERHASGRALDLAAQAMGLPKGKVLVNAARDGDEDALSALAEPMTALGTALAGAVALLDPEAVIFAGGVAGSLDVLEPLIQSALARQLPPHLRSIPLKAGFWGPQAGLVGAAFAGARGEDWRRHR
jgi:predicted NBD/HSP70 family sugar kinase